MLHINNVSFSYETTRGQRKIFDGLHLQCEPGTFYAIMGPSGSGKTTFFRMLSQEIHPTSGTITLDGQNLDQIPRDILRREKIAQIFQRYLLIPYLNAEENILLAREISGYRTNNQEMAFIGYSLYASVHDEAFEEE